ncbi:MAG TPA: class GN sortase, partial [Marinobacter adhaerens]|nr:class GN sortase [Marinobacter adhaerens]
DLHSFPTRRSSDLVLADTHAESLAFGPGRLTGSEDPGGAVIIAGHRDTHFRSLKALETGNEVRLQGRDGRWQSYLVEGARVVDSRSELIDTQRLPEGTLLLVTCYPFDSVDAGGPLRYVVRASAKGKQREQIDTVAGI